MTPATCTHPRANHEHGTLAMARRDACKCPPCVDAARRAAKRNRAGLVQPTSRTDPGPSRRRVEQLLAAGWTIHDIEHATGLNRTALRQLIGAIPGKPPSAFVTRRTAGLIARIPSVAHQPAPDGLHDGTGTRRRLQALIAIGWPIRWLGERIGRATNIHIFLRDDQRRVLGATRDTVRALYDDLWDTPPPQDTPAQKRAASRARRIAENAGWPVPLAWDDDTIDDPHATPHHTTKPPQKRQRSAALADNVAFLLRTETSRETIAKRVGYSSWSHLVGALRRINEHDLATRLSTHHNTI